MSTRPTVEVDVHFPRGGRAAGQAGAEPGGCLSPGRGPRVARLLALAHRCDRLIRTG
jgi:hypothetical protein